MFGTSRVLFWMESEKETTKTQRIMETFGNKWIIGLISIEKISVVNLADSRRLKSPLAGSTGMTFSSLRPNAGFSHVPVPCWDQTSQLYSLNCSGDLKSGMSPWQLHLGTTYLRRWQIRPGFATPRCRPAPSLSGQGLVVAALSALCSGLSQCQPAWWVWAQDSVPCEYSQAHLTNA